MSDAITLTLRARLERAIEVEGIAADRMSTLSEKEISQLPVWMGRRSIRLGDVFDVRGERSPRVRVEGTLDLVDGLAAGMAGGELLIDGTAGRGVARGMAGGSVDVRGDVGDEAGMGMGGGTLRVRGRAGARLGGALAGTSRGMSGGEIVVSGPAGDHAASRCRRGLVVVGSAGADAATGMIAGTLVVLGATGPRVGRGNRRGSIVAIGEIVPPDTYRYACTFKPPHVRLLLTHLQRRFGMAVHDDVVGGRYRRFCGDLGDPGRGEILHWSGESN
jgi:formylmethanofuran dehydrogenase subunit C